MNAGAVSVKWDRVVIFFSAAIGKTILVLMLASLLGLSGCGFERVMPLKMPARLSTMALHADNHYTDFNRELSHGLRDAGVQLVAESTPDTAVIDILSDVSGQTVLSVSATNTPTEYEVFYTVKFRVRVGSHEVLSPTELSLRREYSYSVNAALAKQHEQETVRRALAKEISGLVLRRVATVTW